MQPCKAATGNVGIHWSFLHSKPEEMQPDDMHALSMPGNWGADWIPIKQPDKGVHAWQCNTRLYSYAVHQDAAWSWLFHIADGPRCSYF